MNILSVLPRIPFPLNDGGAIATYNTLKHLHAAGHMVHVLALNTRQHHQEPAVLQDVCADIETVDINTDVKISQALRHFFARVPYKFKRYYSEEFAGIIRRALTEKNIDIVMLDQTPTMVYIDVIRENSPVPVVLRNHNIEHIIYRRMAEQSNNLPKRLYMRRLSEEIRQFESRSYLQCDGIAVMTRADRERLQALNYQGPTAVVPLGFDNETFQPGGDIETKDNTVFYFGAFDWMPNADAVDWFMTEVFEEFRRRFPATELHFGGKNPSEGILKLAKLPGVFVHPNVPSARDYLQSYDIMIVPLLSGGGMRVKIVEAMAMAKPIIATPVGAEGIAASNGKNILFAESKTEFLNAIERLLNDAEYKRTLGAEARKTALAHYDWSGLTGQLADFFGSIIAKKQAPKGSVH